jgi:hypothetical protein
VIPALSRNGKSPQDESGRLAWCRRDRSLGVRAVRSRQLG